MKKDMLEYFQINFKTKINMGTAYQAVDPFSLQNNENDIDLKPKDEVLKNEAEVANTAIEQNSNISNNNVNVNVKPKKTKNIEVKSSLVQATVNTQTVTNTQSVQVSTETEDVIPDLPDLDIDGILSQLTDILKSPSPLTLYKKSNELKENFSAFINYIAKKISDGFSSQSSTVIVWMYQNAKYQQVWINNLKNYLEDSRFFDLTLYFKAVTTFEKEKQYLAKWLLKVYLNNSSDQIESFFRKYKSRYNYSTLKSIYEALNISSAKIAQKYLDENKIERFLEQLYMDIAIEDEKLIWYFTLNLDGSKSKFDDTYEIFSLIVNNYLKNMGYKDKKILDYINLSSNKEIKLRLDWEIRDYFEYKVIFYKNVSEILSSKNVVEKWYFWSYVKTLIIDKYYNEISRLFYWNKAVCSNRNDWSILKWNFALNENSQNYNEIKWILSFKKLILNLNESMLSPFLKPLIYAIVSEKISITQKDLLKLRYLMTLVLSENYNEYKKIYNFFEDLETFLDFNMDKNSLFNINFKKLKIFFADIIITFVLLVFLYIYAPVWVFIWTVLLLLSFFRNHFWTFHAGIEWNFWTKTFATVLLVISWFFWITNLDKTKVDIASITQKVEKLWIYKTDDSAKIVAEKLWNLKLWEMVADILQSNKKIVWKQK